MTVVESIILGIIEGFTEFLPVSSTGHMILASYLLKMEETEFLKTFEVFIQLGAISAIVWLYAKRFLTNWNLYVKLTVAFLPTGFFGFLAYEYIKIYLFNSFVVAVSLMLGGIILILIDEKVENQKSRCESVEDVSFKHAFFIGLFQCLAMVPGVSRAAATIIGGVFNGLSKKQAAEFSFLLAIPTMLAASGYDLLKTKIDFNEQHFMLLGIGFIVAFASAWIAVKLFLKFLDRFGFKYFGFYRFLIGFIFLIWFYR